MLKYFSIPISMSDKKAEDNIYTKLKQVGLLTTIPIMLAAGPIAGYFVGDFLDKKFKSSPIFVAILAVLGFIAGARESIRILKLAAGEDRK